MGDNPPASPGRSLSEPPRTTPIPMNTQKFLSALVIAVVLVAPAFVLA